MSFALSTRAGQQFVSGLIDAGVREAVVAPGSRNAAISLALAEADRSRSLRLHVRFDERSASFLALGLARATGTCVPVVVTSGTAGAHCLAACWESRSSAVALMVITADRPSASIGTGANQTIDQSDYFGRAVALVGQCPLPVDEPTADSWRGMAFDLANFSTSNLTPVHVQAPFGDLGNTAVASVSGVIPDLSSKSN